MSAEFQIRLLTPAERLERERRQVLSMRWSRCAVCHLHFVAQKDSDWTKEATCIECGNLLWGKPCRRHAITGQRVTDVLFARAKKLVSQLNGYRL